jgi:hypothetical protein
MYETDKRNLLVATHQPKRVGGIYVWQQGCKETLLVKINCLKDGASRPRLIINVERERELRPHAGV